MDNQMNYSIRNIIVTGLVLLALNTGFPPRQIKASHENAGRKFLMSDVYRKYNQGGFQVCELQTEYLWTSNFMIAVICSLGCLLATSQPRVPTSEDPED